MLGLGLALVVVGPVLAPGSLLNLDLVLTPHVPVPPAVWGLGPEVPRRVPLFLPIAWLSTVVDGAAVGKAIFLATITVAFVGAHRLARGADPLARVAAGLAYAGGPFLATRLSIGHLPVAVPAALLPWALPTLLAPSASVRRTLLWSVAFGCCGVNGGILAGVAIAVGLVAERGRRAAPVVGAFVAGQLPWLVPGVVVLTQGVHPAGSESFDTRIDGVLGLLRLAGGQGFWIPDYDVGGGRVVVPLAAGVLVALALAGRRRLPAAWGRRATVLAAIGFTVALASAVPGVSAAYGAAADTFAGAPLREGQRMLPLFLVWVAPAAAFGATRLGERRPELSGLLPLAAALALVGPSLWGFGGRLEPVRLPAEWATARRAVEAEPGPVLALPWSQYVQPSLIDGRLVHNPLPYALGGDVLLPSGRGEPGGAEERADPRLDAAGALVERLRAGEAVDAELDALGIRWVAVVSTVDPAYDHLGDDPALRVAVTGDSLTLLEVVDPVADGVDPIIGPLASVGPAPTVWYRPGATGWRRGFDAVPVTEEGNLAVPAGSGPLWYWPSVLVLAADLVTVAAVLAAWRWRR